MLPPTTCEHSSDIDCSANGMASWSRTKRAPKLTEKKHEQDPHATALGSLHSFQHLYGLVVCQ
jgi:hypothetical protein